MIKNISAFQEAINRIEELETQARYTRAVFNEVKCQMINKGLSNEVKLLDKYINQ